MSQDPGWWEIQVCCPLVLEEMVSWRLEDFGCRGTASEVSGSGLWIKAYVHRAQVQESALTALRELLQQDAIRLNSPALLVQWQQIQEEDWAGAWKQHWHPQEVGDRFVIYPAWIPVPEKCDRAVLRLDPGVAFGTGAHATTQLCLKALEHYFSGDPNPVIVADIGCGSGILSIGAALLGAAKIYAVDTDPLAVQATQQNWDLNQLPPKLVVAEGSVDHLLHLPTAPVDGIVCNILAPVIIELMPQLCAIAHANTWAILSGLLVSQAPAVIEAAVQHGWTLTNQQHQQDWCCLEILLL
jgi:ribosomal protein L11 methyltransferase